jgi:hypothetical protein
VRWLAAALVAVLAITGGAGAIERKTTTSAAAPLDPALWPALGLDRPAKNMAAPPVKGVDLGGAPVSLASFRGRVVMLYFWATW